MYLTAEQFTTYYVEAVRGNGLPSFRQKYRGVPLLIVDDLQFFRGKRSTLVELLYTVDTILRDGRQVVFAADRPLAELSDLGSELVSRLKSGMICAIDRPEHATRLGIVEQTARRMAIDVPKTCSSSSPPRLTGHARELSGALCRLQATSEALGEPITLAMAEEALAEMIRHSTRIVRLPDIQKAICDVFGLEPDSLQSGRKGKRVSHPRMLAMWLARKHTRAALSEIGHFFGRRSHSTVVSAQKRVDAWLADGTVLELADHVFDDRRRDPPGRADAVGGVMVRGQGSGRCGAAARRRLRHLSERLAPTRAARPHLSRQIHMRLLPLIGLWTTPCRQGRLVFVLSTLVGTG